MKNLFYVLLLAFWACSPPPKTSNEAALHAFFGEQDMNKTVALCSETLAKYPDNLAALLLRSQAYLLLKNFGAALTDAQHSLQINPQESLALLIRAEAHAALGHWQQALQDLEAAQKVAHSGWQPDIYIYKYRVKLQLQDIVGACQEWENAQKAGVGHLLPEKCLP